MKMPVAIHRSVLAAAAGSLVFTIGAWAGEDKMRTMDTDNDGKISSAEHAAGARLMFQKMDADGDGRVTAAEMDASYKAKAASGGSGATMSSAEKIRSVDADNDGVITAAEHESAARTKFGELDADRDGSLTAAEMQAGHQKMKDDQPR